MLVYFSFYYVCVNFVKETGSAAENDWSAGVSQMAYPRASVFSSLHTFCFLANASEVTGLKVALKAKYHSYVS